MNIGGLNVGFVETFSCSKTGAEDFHLRDNSVSVTPGILFCGWFVPHRVTSCNMTLHPQPFND